MIKGPRKKQLSVMRATAIPGFALRGDQVEYLMKTGGNRGREVDSLAREDGLFSLKTFALVYWWVLLWSCPEQ